MTRRHCWMLLGATALLSAGACSDDLGTGTTNNAAYNGTYVGQGTIRRSPTGYSGAAPQAAVVTLTLSAMGSQLGGSLSAALTSGQYTYTGSVEGDVTSSGGSFTYVQSPCAGTLNGSFVLSNGVISGSAVGRDCDAGATGDNFQITFSNLVRQ